MKKTFILFISIFLVVTVGCSPSLSKVTPTGFPTNADSSASYPGPVIEIHPSYPAPQEVSDNAYPAPQELEQEVITADTRREDIVPFQLKKPITAGMTEVRGTGPKGVPIILSDVTMADTFLAETTVQDNGEFVFVVPPLEPGHRIGVKISDLTGTEWADEPFISEGFFGDEAMLVPQIAFYYDTFMVR